MTSLRCTGATLLSAVVVTTALVSTASARGPRPPKWKSVTITTTCDDKEPELCRGIHGLTVNADGSYVVGPEPGGTKIEDNLSADELAAIAKAAEKLAAASSRARPLCDKGPVNPGGTQTVTLTTAKDKTLTIYQSSIPGKGARCTIGKRSIAIELQSTLGLLLTLHYPLPFPG
jgi:hypothetical protein